MEKIRLVSYEEFLENLPTQIRQVSAQFDDQNIIVYQAFNSVIANFAIENQYFGDNFQKERMTWIKPNFLWMMYRSGWASKRSQERVLAIKISRNFFEELLLNAVLTKFSQKVYKTQENWKKALKESNIRVQWDPSYDIQGIRQEYKAIQIGLKGEASIRYAEKEIIEIIDVTEFVHLQEMAAKYRDTEILRLPEEKVYELSSKIKENIFAS